MAIQKLKTLADGRTGDFWITDVLNVSPDYSHSRVIMDLYESEAAYVSGAVPIYSQDVTLAAGENPVGKSQLVSLVEQRLVSLPGTFVSGVLL